MSNDEDIKDTEEHVEERDDRENVDDEEDMDNEVNAERLDCLGTRASSIPMFLDLAFHCRWSISRLFSARACWLVWCIILTCPRSLSCS